MEVSELLSSFPLPAWSVLLVGLLTAFYVYLTWNFGYWEKQGVKCDKPWPLIGNLAEAFKKPMEEIDSEHYKKYGRVYGMYEGRRPSLMVCDPDMLKTILVKDFHNFRNRRSFEANDELLRSFLSIMKDDDWKELRNIITPTFTTGKMKGMVSLMEECGQSLVNYLRKNYAEKDEAFEATTCLSSFTMDVIATCASGTKLDSLEDPNSEFVQHGRKIMTQPPKLFALVILFPVLVEYLPSFIPKASLNYFKDLVASVISARKKQKQVRRDFLQLLMEAKEESEKENAKMDNGNNQKSDTKPKFVMTSFHVTAQAILFFIAAFEATAVTLSFLLYNLIVHEDVQEKLVQEVDEILKKHSGKITYDAISEMQYMDMVISETLRIYPPAVRLDRECQQDDYDLHGIILKKGCIVQIPTYCIHHDEEFYPNPEKFDPERFSPENRQNRNPYTYMPFGYGLRNCIGMRFALLKMKVALTSLLKAFRIKKCAETQIPFVRSMRNAFLQPNSLKLKLDKRT